VRTSAALAHLVPERVLGLVLIDLGLTGPAGGGLGDDLGQFLKILPEHFADRGFARVFMDAHCPDPSIAQYLMAVSKQDEHGVTFPFDHQALIETIKASIQISVQKWVEDFGRTGRPVLILRGEKSMVYARDLFLQEKQTLAPISSITFEEVKGCGHGLPFERRKEFCERLLRFVSGATLSKS